MCSIVLKAFLYLRLAAHTLVYFSLQSLATVLSASNWCLAPQVLLAQCHCHSLTLGILFPLLIEGTIFLSLIWWLSPAFTKVPQPLSAFASSFLKCFNPFQQSAGTNLNHLEIYHNHFEPYSNQLLSCFRDQSAQSPTPSDWAPPLANYSTILLSTVVLPVVLGFKSRTLTVTAFGTGNPHLKKKHEWEA